MKKSIILLSFLFFTSVLCNSQIYIDNNGNVYDQRVSNSVKKTDSKYGNYQSGNKFDMSKLSIGGSLSLQFGDYTVIGISPQVGYDLSKYFTAGAGFGYTYFKNTGYDYKWSSSYLSFDVFGRFYPIDNIVLSIQPEISRMWQTLEYNRGNSYKESKFVPSFLVGGGIRYAGMIAMLQYDVVQDKNSPYGNNLFYSVGYSFNF